MDTSSTEPLKYYLIYKYEVYDVEYFYDGGERRDEEPECNEPPKLCNGPDAFTVAILEVPRQQMTLRIMAAAKFSDDKDKIRLHVVSTRKPGLTIAGYKDADHPYMPAFAPLDS